MARPLPVATVCRAGGHPPQARYGTSIRRSAQLTAARVRPVREDVQMPSDGGRRSGRGIENGDRDRCRTPAADRGQLADDVEHHDEHEDLHDPNHRKAQVPFEVIVPGGIAVEHAEPHGRSNQDRADRDCSVPPGPRCRDSHGRAIHRSKAPASRRDGVVCSNVAFSRRRRGVHSARTPAEIWRRGGNAPAGTWRRHRCRPSSPSWEYARQCLRPPLVWSPHARHHRAALRSPAGARRRAPVIQRRFSNGSSH